MQFLIRLMASVLISFAAGAFLSGVEKSNAKEKIRNLGKKHIIIRLPKACLWVGCIDIAFFGACMFIMTFFPNDTQSVWVWIGFAVFVLLGICMVSEALIWKIDVFRDKNYFICRTLPYKHHKILYGDCVGYRIRKIAKVLVLKTNNKKTFHVDVDAANFDALLDMLQKNNVKEIK